eukprot:UC1_evm1s623
MFVPPGQFDRAYAQIKVSALSSDCTVTVCCAPDVDALAACAIFTRLLKADFIPYRIVPINGMDDLARFKEDVDASPGTVRSLVLLNAGGGIDLTEYFQAGIGQPNENMTFYVLDSHRPLDLDNVYGDENVLVFDDGTTAVPPREAVQLDSDSEEELEEEEEEEGGRGGGGTGDGGVGDFGGDDGPLAKRPKGRRRGGGGGGSGSDWQSRTAREERREAAAAIQAEYYGESYHGASAAFMMYTLVGQLGRATSNEVLWWGILGVTDQLVHARVDMAAYAEACSSLQADVLRLNGAQGEAPEERAGQLTVATQREFKFMLLRHWSLYESMRHSPYVASRLGIWRRQGHENLNGMLAKIGVSLRVCKQRFRSMDAATRDDLLLRLEAAFEEQGLLDICFPSFVRQREFRTHLSATDVVHAVSALMQQPSDDGAISGGGDGSSSSGGGGGASWRTNFFAALDVLTADKQSALGQGIDLAIDQERVILQQVENLVQTKKAVRKHKTFRYTLIKDDPQQERFANSVVLRKTAGYISETLRFGAADQRKRKQMPFLIAAHVPSTESYNVVGLWADAKTEEGEVARNRFGMSFRAAANDCGARYKTSGFEDSEMEIQSDDIGRFLTALNHQLMRNS